MVTVVKQAVFVPLHTVPAIFYLIHAVKISLSMKNFSVYKEIITTSAGFFVITFYHRSPKNN